MIVRSTTKVVLSRDVRQRTCWEKTSEGAKNEVLEKDRQKTSEGARNEVLEKDWEKTSERDRNEALKKDWEKMS